MKKWTEEPGAFSPLNWHHTRRDDPARRGQSCWDFGTWRQAGISGGGHASVNLWRYHDGEGLVGVAASCNLKPVQARQLARVLWAAADKAEELEAVEE